MSNFELHFEIESNCIFTCKHCSSQAIRKETIRYETEDALRLVEAVNPSEIYFTGGEPLLFQHLLPLFSDITSRSPACKLGLFTTGILRRNGCPVSVESDYLDQLYQAGLRVCYVSLYSDEEKWHDYMTNTPGSFIKTVQAIRNMIAAGIDTRINLVVSRFNFSRIRNIIDFVSRLKVSEVRLLKLIQHGNASKHWNIIGLSDQEYFQAINAVYSSREELAVKITFSSIPKLDPCRPLSNSRGCQARKNLLYVTLCGDIYPCACVKCDTAYSICNLKDTCLEQLTTVNVDKVPYYNSCLAERDTLETNFDNFFNDLYEKYFSEFLYISKSEAIASAIRFFLKDMRLYSSRINFLDLLFKKNSSDCQYYEVHSFFVKRIGKEKDICFVAPDIDISQVRSICESKFSDVQIQYQVINSGFVDQFIKEELLKRLAGSFDTLAFNPENYMFVNNCMDL